MWSIVRPFARTGILREQGTFGWNDDNDVRFVIDQAHLVGLV